jgi:hypothetical protein
MPPLRISVRTSNGRSSEGNPTILSANLGTPPIAYISDNEFAAAIFPNVYGSSTIGVKKSTVWSIVFPLILNAAASSKELKSIRVSLSLVLFRFPRTWERSSGDNLQAQPAPLLNFVSLTFSFI